MDAFFEKLEKLTKALANFNASIKQPKMPGIKQPQQPKLPGQPSGSKKDPVKVAEQLKNADLTAKQSPLKIAKNGQWSL